MIENLKEFMVKMLGDKKTKKDFEDIARKGSMEDLYQFALKNSRGGFTKKEFEDYISEFAEELDYAKKNLVNDEYLDNVAGGIKLPGKSFWEGVKDGKINAKDALKDETALDYIYRKEKALTEEESKAAIVQAGFGAAGNVVDLLGAAGNIMLAVKDIKNQKRAREDAALGRKVEHYKNLLIIDELQRKCKEAGIDLSAQ